MTNTTSSFELSVRPGTTYEFGGWARASSGGQAAVRVRWIGGGEDGVGDDGIRRLAATSLVSDDEWTEVKITAAAPGDARAARIELLNAGAGSAGFDDVFLREAEGEAKGATASSGSLTVQAAPDGAITVTRNGEVIFEGASVVDDGDVLCFEVVLRTREVTKVAKVGAEQV